MGDINVQEFPDSLTEEQRAAVLAHKKGILPFILLGIISQFIKFFHYIN